MDAESELRRGLEGVTVAETRLSRVDGEAGELLIAGYPVEELASAATYEETVFLLLTDRLPTGAERRRFRERLVARRGIDPAVRGVLERAAATGVDPMDAVRMGVAAASVESGEGPNAEADAESKSVPGAEPESDPDAEPDGDADAEPTAHSEPADSPVLAAKEAFDVAPETIVAIERAVAVLPTVVATYWRYRDGSEPVDPDPDLGHAANYLWMLTGESPDDAAVRGLETYLNSVIDHGLNASTFTARVIVSTESDAISGITGAVGALKGPLHGGAPGPVLDMLRTVHERGDPEGYVEERLAAGERLMGFGHRVYRVRDPRAAVLEAAAERFFESGGDADFFETVRAFEDVAVERLAAHKPDRRLETNVEYYTATLLAGVGIPRDLFAPTFAVGRVGGWGAHAAEQLGDNRLIRPRGRYVGATGRTWVPVGDR